MAVVFNISAPLRSFAGRRERVEIETTPAQVRNALEALWSICPGLRNRLMTERGEVRPHVNIFVGNENIRHTGGLETPLCGDTEISILPAVSGGSWPADFVHVWS